MPRKRRSIVVPESPNGIDNHRPRIVENAIIIGPLAVHRSIKYGGGYREGWVVSHIDTGYSVKQHIDTRDDAIKIAMDLRHLNWKFSDPKKMPPKTKEEVLSYLYGR